jgi:ATP-dependent Clp protease ATP-binding subunit ClpA
MLEPSDKLQAIFERAIDVAQKLEHEYVTLEHLVFAIMCDEEIFKELTEYGANGEFIKVNLEQFLKNNLFFLGFKPLLF